MESTRRAFLAGEGLQPSATASTVRIEEGKEPTVTDGPFAESKEQLGGFYLLECKDLDEALEYAKKIPFQNGSIEVRPVMDYSEFGYENPGRGRGQAPRHRHPARPGRRPPVPPRVGTGGREPDPGPRRLRRRRGGGQEAFVVALERWPSDGVPDNPGAWITRVARNKAIDRPAPREDPAAKKEVLEGLEALAPSAEELEVRRRSRRCPTTGCG